MSLAYWSLSEIFDRFLIAYYLEEVTGLSCQVCNVQGEAVLTIGAAAALPKLSADDLKELAASPLPIDVQGGRAAGLFAKSDYLGYAVVSVKSETDVVAADFVFQLLNFSTAQQMERDEVQFTADYLRNMMSLMQRLSEKTAEVFDRRQVGDIFVQECQQLFGVKSGAIWIFEKSKSELVKLSSFGPSFESMERARNVQASGKIHIENTKTDKFLNEMVIPLQAGPKQIGVLYLRDREMGPFSEDDQNVALTLSAMLGAMIAGIQSHENLVATERVRMNLGRYLSPNLLKEVVESGQFRSLGGKRMRTAILFTDIRGFTKLSEKISPEAMVAQLNEYFEEMSKVIFKFDGTLDKFVGDMIMVLFGVPKPMVDATERAVRTAIEMQERIKLLNAKWAAEKKQNFHVGMGINVGEVIFGNLGSSQAMGLTVIGDHVNQAQRLEAFAKGGQILVTESVVQDLAKGKNPVKTQALGPIEVKGKQINAFNVNY